MDTAVRQSHSEKNWGATHSCKKLKQIADGSKDSSRKILKTEK